MLHTVPNLVQTKYWATFFVLYFEIEQQNYQIIAHHWTVELDNLSFTFFERIQGVIAKNFLFHCWIFLFFVTGSIVFLFFFIPVIPGYELLKDIFW